ncbi:aminotransferase class V-fold PLP-dependent enzyme [Arthrobacter liuii]|uniref:Aminotransferase class V n=1 Tax=Arthrobacter liuii TaxID=1476996 RepID=A0ABQ2B1G7_9MICC|nr:aminotransferase class V-fold PLP-dependent enzyme [Arthrobacter liuii]GGI02257.1 aminotransferase class V [Arthrobacter liuii]
MSLNIGALRADTPGTRTVAHLNNAGSSLMPRPVTAAVVGHLRREEQVGGYEAAAEAAAGLEDVYSSVASLVGGHPDEIALMESGSTAWALAVALLPVHGRRILVARTEYRSNILVLIQLATRLGLKLAVLEEDTHGNINLAHLRRELVRGDVALVALTHVPMTGGLVNPAPAVGRLCADAGVPFILDACQSVGQLPLDVAQLACDILIGTGRKFLRGPRGTAFAYVRASVLEQAAAAPRSRLPLLRDNGEERLQARLLESREASMALRIGLGRAVDYALDLGIPPIRERVLPLAQTLRSHLAVLPRVRVHGQEHPGSGIVTFSVSGSTAWQVKEHLARQHINVSTVAMPPSGTEELLPITARTPTAVRASVHYYNSEEEIQQLISALR